MLSSSKLRNHIDNNISNINRESILDYVRSLDKNGKLVFGRKLSGLPVFSKGSELTVGKINKDSTFHGKISDVRYFDKTLSNSEISKLYSNKP